MTTTLDFVWRGQRMENEEHWWFGGLFCVRQVDDERGKYYASYEWASSAPSAFADDKIEALETCYARALEFHRSGLAELEAMVE